MNKPKEHVPPGFPPCRHIKADGERCGSPALSGRNFCYWHTLHRRRNKPNKNTSRALNACLVDADDHWHQVPVMEPFAKRYTLGPLEDGASLQVAISTVLNALADNRIDMGRATTLLYGLQLASTNLKNFQRHTPANTEEDPELPATHSTAGTYAQVSSTEQLTAPAPTELQQKEELAQK